MGNNKTIGAILIVIGIAFIALGVWSGIPKTATKTPAIYNEQNETNIQENDVNESIYSEDINVYTEQSDEESTRYIY